MGIQPPQRCGFGLPPTLLVAEDVGWDKVVLDGDSQILISQICNLNDPADWIIEEDVQHLQRIVSLHSSWCFSCLSRDANSLAQLVTKWCFQQLIY